MEHGEDDDRKQSTLGNRTPVVGQQDTTQTSTAVWPSWEPAGVLLDALQRQRTDRDWLQGSFAPTPAREPVRLSQDAALLGTQHHDLSSMRTRLALPPVNSRPSPYSPAAQYFELASTQAEIQSQQPLLQLLRAREADRLALMHHQVQTQAHPQPQYTLAHAGQGLQRFPGYNSGFEAGIPIGSRPTMQPSTQSTDTCLREQVLREKALSRTDDDEAPPPLEPRRRTIAFPEKLHKLLLDCEVDQQTHIASFVPNGLAFQVHDEEAFVKDIIPKYFRIHNMGSFRRQLYLYGFTKYREGKATGYVHPHFQRSRPDWLSSIRRTYNKPEDAQGQKKRKAES